MGASNQPSGKVSYTYNSDGTIQTKTDAKGTVTEYSYDWYKRVQQVKVGANVLYTYTYDTAAFPGASNVAGRLAKVEYPAGLFTVSDMYSYTASGLVSKKRLHVSKAGKQGFMDVDYTYDKGQVSTVTYPESGSSTVTYTYGLDAMRRPNKLTRSGTPAKEYVKDSVVRAGRRDDANEDPGRAELAIPHRDTAIQRAWAIDATDGAQPGGLGIFLSHGEQ
jgi:YD repeat-containing protein